MSILLKHFENFDDEEISHWEENSVKKICSYCKKAFSRSAFPKHKSNKDGLDTRCKSCIEEQTYIRKELHKISPPRPETCECCGKIPKKWSLDHDHKTLEIRGWICDPCNMAIGRLGDNIEGVKKALIYLEKCKKVYNTRNLLMIKQDSE
jgi:hypothetical protein